MSRDWGGLLNLVVLVNLAILVNLVIRVIRELNWRNTAGLTGEMFRAGRYKGTGSVEGFMRFLFHPREGE